MTNYEQKVRERAEEISLITNPKSKGYTLERIAKRCEPIARLCLQREAEAYAKGVRSAINDYRETELSSLDEEHINFELQSLGLVP